MIPILIFFAYAALCSRPHLGTAVPELIGVTGVVMMLLTFGAAMVETRKNRLNATDADSWSPAVILGLAAFFRLMFVWRPLELSDDLYRYVFDGAMIISGRSPYGVTPKSITFPNPELARVTALINHPDIPTIYPPAAQGVFAMGALAGGVLGMKLTMTAFDIGACAIILHILKQMGLSPVRGILYAWHPLAVLEVGASGHVDAAALFFLSASFLMVSAETTGVSTPISSIARPALAGVAAGLAVLTKWMPLVFCPGLLLLLPGFQKRLVFMVGLTTAFVLLIPMFGTTFQDSLKVVGIYVQHWEFSGLFFRLLRHLTGSGALARLLLALGFSFLWVLLTCRPYRERTPQQLAWAWHGTAIAWLVCTPTLHPWYALYLAALLPLAGGPAGVILSWTVLLAYRILIPYLLSGQWNEDAFTPVLILAGPLGAVLCNRIAWLIQRSKTVSRG